MKAVRMVAVLAEALVVVGVCGCWSPLVVGDTWSNSAEWGMDKSPIYGIWLQPMIGFNDRNVVGVNVAARLEPDVSGDRKPNASEVVGLAVGAVHHEVWGDVWGVQVGCVSADARRHVVNGVQIGGIGTVAREVNGVQIAAGCNEAKSCYGLQLSLLGNCSWDGMVAGTCTTNTSRCVQVGLVNVCGDHWFPLVNFNFRDCENYDSKNSKSLFDFKFRPW